MNKNANKALILTIIKILFFYHVLAIKYRKRCCSVQKSTGIFFIKAYTFFSICKKRKKAKNSVDVLEEIFQNNVKKKPVDLVVILQLFMLFIEWDYTVSFIILTFVSDNVNHSVPFCQQF